MYQKQSTTLRPHMINPIAVQPLLRILRDDTRALRAKVLTLKNTTAKGFKSYRFSFEQVQLCTYHSQGRRKQMISSVRGSARKARLMFRVRFLAHRHYNFRDNYLMPWKCTCSSSSAIANNYVYNNYVPVYTYRYCMQ